MSFNIRYDNPHDGQNSWKNRKEELTNLIEYYHPDFLGIQEGLYNQVHYIQNNTTKYMNIGVGRDDGKTKGEFVTIFYDTTKFELMQHNTFWLSENADSVSIGWDAALERICTYGKFKDKRTDRILHIFNAHFDHVGTKARVMSAMLILSKVNKYCTDSSKIVFLGDLNSEPKSETINILKSIFNDGLEVSMEKFYGPIGTFNGFTNDMLIPNKRIDYIFVKNLAVNYYRHIDDRLQNNYWISDHLPILIEVSDIK